MKDSGLFGKGADFADAVFKAFAVADGAVFDSGSVVVDGVGTVAEQFGNLRAGVNAESDERENAQFGVQGVLLLGVDAFIGFEERIEFIHEIGVDGEERVVEMPVESGHFFFEELCGCQSVGFGCHFRHLSKVVGIGNEVERDVAFLDIVGFVERMVDVFHFLVHRVQPFVLPYHNGCQNDSAKQHDSEDSECTVEPSGGLLSLLFVGLVDDLRHLIDLYESQPCVENSGIVEGILHIVVGALDVALSVVVDDFGEYPTGGIVRDAASNICDGGFDEP